MLQWDKNVKQEEQKDIMLKWILLAILIIMIIALVVLYFFGRKMEKRQAENQAQMDAMAQTTSMLIIDKKRLKMKESGLPQMIIDQTPWYLRRSKLPIVKAKVGPKIMTLIADEKIYEMLPVKKEVKVVVSGIYITAIKGARGGLEKPQPKKGFFKRLFKK
jgi:Na+/H+ antiporter NhaC